MPTVIDENSFISLLVFHAAIWNLKPLFLVNHNCLRYLTIAVMGVGSGAGGPWPPWILKISAKKGCFLEIE